MKKGLECHIRELDLDAEGSGEETLEMCQQEETGGGGALERLLWPQWGGSLEPMTGAGSHFSGKSLLPLVRSLLIPLRASPGFLGGLLAEGER